MKKTLQKLLVTMACLLCSIGVYAHDFEYGSIYYNITSETNKTVEVTFKGSDYSSSDDKYTGSVVIPENVTHYGVTYSVTSIGSSAFESCYGLTSVTIPNSVTTIGSSAFNSCTGLTSLQVEAITPPSISDNTFYKVSIAVNVPAESVDAYKNKMVWSSFTNIVGYTEMAEGDKFTVDGIYYEITNIENSEVAVTFAGDSYNAVSGEYAGKVVIPETVTYQDATYNVTSIVDNAFTFCNDLTSVTIPNSITSMGEGAFNTCRSLTEVILPERISKISKAAFLECRSLKTIEIPNSVTEIGPNAFYRCESLQDIKIPDNVTLIDYGAFGDCIALTEITIPNKVTTIGNTVFENCTGLKSVTIGSGVTSIGDQAFWNCTGLTSLHVEAITPPTISVYTFYNVNTSIPVYVPAESVGAYKKRTYDNYWKSFENIQAIQVGIVSLTLDKYELSMVAEEQVQLNAIISPNNATNKAVVWSSSDENIATVEDGVVTAISVGVATITATTTDGSNLSASCEITVKQKMVELSIQSSYYNNIVIYELPGTEKMIKIVTIDEAYKLNSVWFNEVDVTNEVVDGIYTTPALEEDAYISISFIIPTGENDVMQNGRIKAYGYKGDVVVVGCMRGKSIAIYDVDGIKLRSVYATSDTMRIAMPTDAVYVVQVGDTAVKVAL